MINTDPALALLGGYFSVVFIISIDGQSWRFNIQNGVLSSLSRTPDNDSADAGFTLTIEPDSWVRFGEQMPPPAHYDVSAIIEHRYARLSGD